MLNWFEEQLETRQRYEDEEIEEAYARLAASITGSNKAPRFTLDDVAASEDAIQAIMGYFGMKPYEVPPSITDPLERIEYAVRPSGVMKRTVRLEGKWWQDATGVYLGRLKEGGIPVAIIPFGIQGYGFVDPATKKKVRLGKRTAPLLETDALCFYRPLPQRELNLKDLFAYMLRAFDSSDYLHIILASLITALLGLLPAIATGLMFKRIIPSNMPSLLFPIASLLLGITISQRLIAIASSTINNRLKIKLNIQIEAATYARVLLLPPSFFRDYAPGDLANRVMGMNSVVQVLSDVLFGSGLSALMSLIYIGQIYAYAPALTLPAFITLAVQITLGIVITLVTMRYSRIAMQRQSKISGITPSILRGIQKIKLSGAERRAFSQWANAYAQLSTATYDRPALLLAAPNLVPLVSVVGTIVIYFVAATTAVDTADYMAFNTAFGAVSGALTMLISTATEVANIKPMLELVEPIMRTVPETVSTQKQITGVEGSVEVSNLSFRYAEKSPLILKNLSLRIRRGEYVAIVGRTGCGKSTLMRLLLGFEKPTKGAIYYSGQDLSSIDVRSLRRNIGVVLQGSSLFTGDLFSNITVACPRATLDDAWDAAELAGIADDIRKMPMGMQTLVTEGSGGVSGGQRQRIMIARAVCGKPSILMLDEATSALDNVTQRHVSDALANLNCTRIVVAHRLSTIKNADRIIMIEDGVIVEDGTYDELVDRGGAFADLVERQRLECE